MQLLTAYLQMSTASEKQALSNSIISHLLDINLYPTNKWGDYTRNDIITICNKILVDNGLPKITNLEILNNENNTSNEKTEFSKQRDKNFTDKEIHHMNVLDAKSHGPKISIYTPQRSGGC